LNGLYIVNGLLRVCLNCSLSLPKKREEQLDVEIVHREAIHTYAMLPIYSTKIRVLYDCGKRNNNLFACPNATSLLAINLSSTPNFQSN
jgi:hypothetical protein